MPVKIKSVSNTVVDYLRSQIITGKLAANQRINENDLASDLGVSRPPIREAFRTLEAEQLIISRPRKGTYVADVSVEDLTGLYQAREMIECYSISLLKAMNIRELPEVEACLEQTSHLTLPSSGDENELVSFVKAAVGFHSELVKATGNLWIIRFYESISLHMTRYQLIYFCVPGSLDQSNQDHREILDLIKQGEFDRAKEALVKHVQYLTVVLKKKLLQNQVEQQETSSRHHS